MIVMLVFFYINTMAQDKHYLLIGTYTKSQNKGIFVYEFDSTTGDLKLASNTENIINPSFLTINKSGTKVYSVGESEKGMAYAFDFDKKTGQIKQINKQQIGGDSPCYVTLSEDEKSLFIANYGSGDISVLNIESDGTLSSESDLIKQTGSSVTSRQQKSHAHSIVKLDNKHFLSANLGADKLFHYVYDAKNQTLKAAAQEYIQTHPGSGPRHIAVNKNQEKIYVIGELDASVLVYSYKNNKLKELQRVDMNAPEFNGENGAADIHLTTDGKFLYASNRGSANEIVVFSVDNKGLITKIGAQSTLGVSPRNFAIDPSGKFLLVAHQNTDDVVVFKRNILTGMLQPTGIKINVGAPVCLVFAKK